MGEMGSVAVTVRRRQSAVLKIGKHQPHTSIHAPIWIVVVTQSLTMETDRIGRQQ